MPAFRGELFLKKNIFLVQIRISNHEIFCSPHYPSHDFRRFLEMDVFFHLLPPGPQNTNKQTAGCCKLVVNSEAAMDVFSPLPPLLHFPPPHPSPHWHFPAPQPLPPQDKSKNRRLTLHPCENVAQKVPCLKGTSQKRDESSEPTIHRFSGAFAVSFQGVYRYPFIDSNLARVEKRDAAEKRTSR